MKRSSLALMFLFVTITQSAYPMAGSFNRFATWTSRTLFFTPFVGYIALNINTKINFDDEKWKMVNTHTENFVRGTLLDAGYPTKMVEALSIKTERSSFGFGARYATDGKTIVVPRKLKRAIEKPTDREDEFDAVIVKDISKENGIEEDVVKTFCGGYGLIKADNTLLCAKGALVHEGGHIYHEHAKNQKLKAIGILLGVPSTIQMITSGSAYMINQGIRSPLNLTRALCKLGGLPVKLIAAIGVISLYSQSKELQADNEVIQRVKDSAVLRAHAEFFQAADRVYRAEAKKKFNSLINNYPNIGYFLVDPHHPHPLKRAEYFRKAAEELEKNQTK